MDQLARDYTSLVNGIRSKTVSEEVLARLGISNPLDELTDFNGPLLLVLGGEPTVNIRFTSMVFSPSL